MAAKGVQLDYITFSCPICLELLKNPVTLPCGHNYCMSCIEAHWKRDERGFCSCPQCRKIFTPRPALLKNTMLAALVEELEKTELEPAKPDCCYAGPEDVACDVCTNRKLKASKSCLQCLISYCKEHLQLHFESPAFDTHKLVEPFKKLQANICPSHNEVMKMFCQTDKKSICYLCSVEEHEGHEIVSAAAERKKRQRELEVSQQNIKQRIQDRRKDVKVLQQQVRAINLSADEAVEDSEKIFTELEKRRSDLKQQIRTQQRSETSRVKELEETLEQEITELERRASELEKLSNSEDHNQFLHDYSSLAPLRESTCPTSINTRSLEYFKDVTAAVKEAKDELEEVLNEKWAKISKAVTDVDVLLPQPEPETRDDLLKYSCELTLDPNTANAHLLLSEGNRKATSVEDAQPYPSHPDRFTDIFQVLSKESLTGRCYWEVEWSGDSLVAVTYKNIPRLGQSVDQGFGRNNNSWALYCNSNGYVYWYNNIHTLVKGPLSSRLGVFLDKRAGILSFYSVAKSTTLLHRVQTAFTQPLYAGFFTGSSAEFCKLK